MRQFVNRYRRSVSALLSISMAFQPLVAAAAAGGFTYQVPFEGRNQAMASAGQLAFNPGSHDFGTLVLGSAASFTTSVKNTGQEGVTITGFPLPAPYTQSNTCPAVLVGGASCNISVTYNPQTAGTFNGSLNVTTAEAGAQASFGIAGAAVVPTTNLTLSANSVDFADADVGTPAAAKSVTVTNAGNSPATVNGIGIPGSTEFNQSNNCGAALAPGAHCTIDLTFVPSEYGARSAGLSIYEQASGTLYNVALAGSGNAAVMLVTPGSKDFGSAIANYSTTSGQVTVSNTGNLPMKDLFFDAGATDFSVKSTTCSASLAANASCTATVEFAPTATGERTANLVVHSTNAGTNHAALTGTGLAQAPSVKASVATLAFGDIPMDAASAPKSVTFTNDGNVKVPLSAMSIVAGAANYQVTSNCPSPLAVGTSCVANVVFAPHQSGALTGTLRAAFTSGALDVALSGTGTLGQASVSASSVPFADQQVASASAPRTVTVTNTGNRTLTFTGVGIASGATDFSQTNDCSAVAPAGTCTLNVVFKPSVAGARTGTLAMVHDGVGTTLIDLSGKGQDQGASLSTPTFAATAVNSSSTAVATLQNTGIGALSVTVPTSASVTGSGYSFVSTTCGPSVAVGAACSVTVKFSPTSVSPTSGNLTIVTGAGTQTVSMGSTGIQGFATVSPSSLTFSAQQVASTSTAQTVTVTNTGTDVLTFTGVGVSAGATDFAQSNNCGAVAVGGTCTVNVAFTPAAAGTRTGTLAFTHNGGGIATVALTGTGQAQSASLSTPTFPVTAVGSSNTAVATLTNTGIGALSTSAPGAVSVTGAAYSFVSSTCAAALAPGATCTTTVRFSPTSTAAASGALALATGAGTQTATLGATGIQGFASVNPASLTYATQQVASTSTAQTVTVTNTGTDVLTFTGAGVSAGATDFAQSNNCGAVAVGGTCTVNVAFTPTAVGARTGTLAFTHNGGGIATVSLSGTGQAASATLSNIAFGNVNAGASSTLTSTLTNTGLAAISVTPPTAAAVTGADFSFVSTTCGATLAAGATCAVSVKLSPSSGGARSGSLSFATEAGPQTATLTGSGDEAVLTFSYQLGGTTVNWGNRQIGGSYNSAIVTLANSGNIAANSLVVTPTSAWTLSSNTCGSSLAAGASCTFQMTLSPVAVQAYNGTVSATAAVSKVTNMMTVTGFGVAQSATMSTPSFAATSVGSSNNASATLTNTGVGPLSVAIPAAGSVTGAGYSFVSTTCGTSVAVGASCDITVKFSPTSTAAANGTLSVATGAGTQSVGLGSTGIQGFASVSPSSLTFAAQQNGTTSAAQVVTVTNTGTDILTFTGVGISVGGSDFAQSNNCGAVAVNGTCTVNVTFTPSASGARPGTLSFTHNGGGIANVSLTGTGQAASATLSSPAFPSTMVSGTNTAAATLTNTGIGNLSVTVPTASAVTGTDFSFVATNCPATLAPAGTCITTVRFSPTATTARTGSVAIATGAGTQTASLSATGIQGNASLTAGSLTYAATQVGTAATGQSVTVTNNGTATLTFTSVSVTSGAADFTQASPACTSLAVNATCVITVNFTPTATGARTGTVTLAHNGTGSTSISLTGTGQAQSASLSAPAFSNSIAVGASGTAVSTLTNTGIGVITLTAPAAGSVTGTDFSFVSTTCGASLAASGTCATTVRFSPTAVAARTGSLVIATSAGTQTATLAATGVQGNASLSAASLGFTTKQVGDSAPAQAVTVTNNGTNPLVFTSVSVTAGATDFTQSSPACTTLAVNGTCTITVTFTPTAGNARTGTVTLAHNGGGATTISLSGTGQYQSAILSSPSFAPTAVGASNTGTTSLVNTGVGALSVTIPTASSVTGAGYSFVSTTCGTSVPVSGSCTTTIRFSPTSTTTAPGMVSIDTGGGTKLVTLGSTGIQGYASVSPASLTFATQQNGTTSGAQVVTVTNTGTDTLTFTGVGISSGATDFAQSNNCGAVAVNGTCTVNVTFTPSTAGSRSGNLSFTHNGGGIANVSLTGTGQAASATLSAPAFPSTMVGGTNTAAATLTNTGIGNLSVTVPTASAVTGTDFSFVATNCPATLAPAGTCITTVRFSPTATTPRTGSVSVVTGAGTQTASLASTGVQGIASLSQGSIAFSPKQVGESVTAGNVVVTNTGTSTLTFTSVSVTSGAADFTQTSPGCTSLAVNATCAISVTFTPSTTGARSGTVTLAHNGTGSTSIALTGTGQAQSASLSTPSFPATAVGSSNTAVATLTNTGVGTLATTAPAAASVTGAAYSFVSTTCTTSLAAGGTCATTVRFSPTSTAAASGTLSIATGAGTQSVTLGSTGIQGYASVNPSSLTYGTYGQWTTSPAQTVTVTNTGTNTLTFTGVGISVGSSDFAQSNNCGSVAVGGTCTVNVTFSPSTPGARTGTLSFTHNGGGIANVSLSGTGQGPSGYLTMGSFPTTTVGSSSTAVATYVNTGIGPAPTGIPSAASVTGNAAFSFVSTDCTSMVPVNSSCSTTIRFSPTSTAAATGNFAINDWNQWHNATLSATGIQGNASLASASLSFANGTTSTTSSTQSTTLTNNGNTSLVVSSVTVTAGASAFSRSTDCVGTLGVGASCTISSTFSPVGAGANSGTITIAHNGSGATTISLSGTAYVPASVTGASFSPSTVTSGYGSTFSWSTANASSASVSCSGTAAGSSSGTSGSVGVSTSSTGTGTCTVTAYNPAGTPATGSANISVIAAPYVATAYFSQSTVTTGYGSTFYWSTGNATSASVSCSGPAAGSSSGTSGSLAISTSGTGTGYCTVTAYNAAGQSSAYSAPISVVAAPYVATAYYSASTVTSGYGSTFYWSTGNATSASVSCSGPAAGSSSGTSGNLAVSTSSTGTGYCTVTAYNAAGQSSAYSAPISVVAAPWIATASFSPTTVTSGNGSTFSWSTGAATSASVSCSGAASGSSSGTSGSLGVGTSGTGTGYCSVTAYNSAGNSAGYTASFSVVGAATVTGASFNAGTVTTGNGNTFNWNTSGATSASVSCSGAASGSGSGTSGSISVSTSGTGTGTCYVTAYNAAGNAWGGSGSFNVVAAPSVTGASFSPGSVTSGAGSTFSWSTSGATSASVSCSAPASGSGSGTSGSIAVSTSGSGTGYCTVTAYNDAGASASGSAALTVTAAAKGTFGYVTRASCGGYKTTGQTYSYTLSNTGAGTITGITYACNGGPFQAVSGPSSLAPSQSGTFTCLQQTTGTYGCGVTVYGSNVNNSGAVFN